MGAVFNGICEITTVFLNIVMLSKEKAVGLPRIATTTAGAMLWLTWFPCRFGVFLSWLWMWFSDVASSDFYDDPNFFNKPDSPRFGWYHQRIPRTVPEEEKLGSMFTK